MKFQPEIDWDGEKLSAWAQTDSGRILCEAPRNAIHCLSSYNDVVSWEINRFRGEIMEHLKPVFAAKIAGGDILHSNGIRLARLRPDELL